MVLLKKAKEVNVKRNVKHKYRYFITVYKCNYVVKTELM